MREEETRDEEEEEEEEEEEGGSKQEQGTGMEGVTRQRGASCAGRPLPFSAKYSCSPSIR